MDVSVLVVTWNNEPDVRACLDAVLASEGVALEVVVVDNASTDGTRAVLADYSHDPRVTLLLQERNLGYAEGNNLAARQARGRTLLLLNPDCAVAPTCVHTLLRHLETTPGCGAAAARLRYPDGRLQEFLRRDVSLGVALWGFLEWGRRLDARLLGDRHLAHRVYREVYGAPPDVVHDVDCPAAACVLLHRSVVAGELFDPAYPLYFNDADLYRRLRARGYAVQLVPHTDALHRYGASVAEVPSGRRRAETVASLRRYVDEPWSAPARVVLWTLLLLDAALCLLRRSTRETGRGTLGGLGLPGGRAPWLSEVPPARVRLRRAARRLKASPFRLLNVLSRTLRRWRFVAAARAAAFVWRCDLELDVARSADLPRRVRFELPRGGRARLRIGPHCLVRPDLVLRLSGDLDLGPYCEVRQGVVLNVKGELRLVGRVVLGRGAMVHADGTMVWEWGATTGEYVSVLDSHHEMDGTLAHVFDRPVVHNPVVIGASSLIGAHSVVLPGVRVGRAATVGAGSVVTRDVPDGAVAVGVPARTGRPTGPAAVSPLRPARPAGGRTARAPRH